MPEAVVLGDLLLLRFSFLFFLVFSLRFPAAFRRPQICSLALARDDLRFEELRVQIYPQSGTNGIVIKADAVAIVKDRAIVDDERCVELITAGRAKPPPAIAAGFKGSLRIAISSALTLPNTIGAEMLFRFCYAEKEHLVECPISGVCAVLGIFIRCDLCIHDHCLLTRRKSIIKKCPV